LAWAVQLAAAAEKTLLKLDPPVARRIVRKLDDIAADGSRIINVVRIGHRSDVYRN
jgi:mRNA-degrading endonuclease RelE of RelBE toxin-antitoxin system